MHASRLTARQIVGSLLLQGVLIGVCVVLLEAARVIELRDEGGQLERFVEQFTSWHEVANVREAVRLNTMWTLWNTFLAAVPAWCAWRLATGASSPTWVRVLLAAAFVAFLPNAPYVATDLMHLPADVRDLGWTPAVLLVLVPMFVVFVVTGMTLYACSMLLTHRMVVVRWGRSRAIALLVALHVACACGIWLGRVLRLNSWQFVTDPEAVVAGVGAMVGSPAALWFVAVVAVATAAMAGAAVPVARLLVGQTLRGR